MPNQRQRDEGSIHRTSITSLLENDLGVSRPLHISLSRPVALPTADKDSFLPQLRQAVANAGIKAFATRPKDLAWHPNESSSRWFLVLRLEYTPELNRLLDVCNATATKFGQPLLYAGGDEGSPEKHETDDGQFHISLAWSLEAPQERDSESIAIKALKSPAIEETGVPYELLGQLGDISISFAEVKVRIGQDVHNIALKPRR